MDDELNVTEDTIEEPTAPHRVLVSFKPKTTEALRLVAKEWGVSEADVVRTATVHYLQEVLRGRA